VTFSPEWASIYADGTAPPCSASPDLWMTLKDIAPMVEGSNALELGCGNALNFLSFKQHGFSYYGTDGSERALLLAAAKFPELEGRLALGDFTRSELQQGFSVIADRAAVSHNDTASIRRCIEFVYKALSLNGIFIGIDWFGCGHSEFCLSRGETVDERTRTGYADGQFRNVGCVHFTDRKEIEDIFSAFEIVILKERSFLVPAGYPGAGYNTSFIAEAFRGSDYRSVVWDIVARKRR